MLDSGLQYKVCVDAGMQRCKVLVGTDPVLYCLQVLKSGPEDGPQPAASTPCSCHYKGTLMDGTEFDSSYSRGEPTTFAPNQVCTKGDANCQNDWVWTVLPPAGYSWVDRSHAVDEAGRQVGAVHSQ